MRPEDQYTIPPAADADPRPTFWEPWSQTGWSDADPDLVRRGLMMLLERFPTLDVRLVQELGNGWTLVEFAYRTQTEKVPLYAIRHLTGDIHMVVDNHAEHKPVCRLADASRRTQS